MQWRCVSYLLNLVLLGLLGFSLSADWTFGLAPSRHQRLELPDAAEQLQPELKGSEAVGLVIVADGNFRQHYQGQISSVRCYAQKNGYDLWLLHGDEFEECGSKYYPPGYYFFQKHCVVAALLEEQSAAYTVAVLDADVVAVVLDRNLSYWIQNGGDLQFYGRITGVEIASGNYIASNKPWVLEFLRYWAHFRFRQPSGFSSADNGALHLALLEILELPETLEVQQLYSNLTENVENLQPYWHFIQVATGALRARSFHLGHSKLGRLCNHAQSQGLGDCVLSVWPRMNFFVADGVYLDNHGSSIGPVMHHGIKSQEWMLSYFKDLEKCVVNPSALVSPKQLGAKAIGLAEGYSHLYRKGMCPQCTPDCLATFTCLPTAP